jgi:hypothetical protein
MGFLSKFFGGDAGTPSQKPESAEAPRSAPEPERAADKRDAAAAAPPPVPASRPASKEEVTVNARAPKEVLPPKEATPKDALAAKDAKSAAVKEALAVKEAAAKEPPAFAAAAPKAPAGAPAPGSSKGVPPSTVKATGGLPPASKLGAPPARLGASGDKPGADKPAAIPGKPAVEKAAAGAEKTEPADRAAAADKVAAPEKAAVVPPEKPPAAGARGVPPERRRTLEDSVITSAPKLPAEGAARAAAPGRPPPKAGAKTAPGNAPPKPAVGEKAAPPSADASGVPALRPRRDHNKSPGFYSSVSPAHGAHAVSGGPFAPAQNKKATVVGLAPPPDPIKSGSPSRPDAVATEALAADAAAPEAARGEPARFEPVPPVTSALAEPTAAIVDPSKLVPAASDPDAGEPLVDLRTLASEDDSFAPPQPCSTPPSVSPVAREEKEETSPGLGNARSRHDPGAGPNMISGTDLELLLAFALDLALGCASEAWFVPLRAAVGRLLAGDAAIRSTALEKALTTLANDLEQPGAFSEENRQRLYGHVVAVDLALAKRMDVTGQKAIRERLIVDQLLEDLAPAHPMVIRRIRDQGPLSLETLARSSAEALSQKLEAPTEAAAQVASIFQGYLEARAQRGPTVALLGKSVALRERLSALEASAEAFDRASEGDDPSARRNTRRQRQNDVTQLNLLLAEFGEAKTLAEIERCSVQAKIERMQRLIAEQEANSGRRAAKPSSPA